MERGDAGARRDSRKKSARKGGSRASQVFRTCSALPEYLARIVDYRQMDLDATFYQMVTLCVQPSKVYKSAYYRKQTKNRWARDDPAFAVIQLLFLLVRRTMRPCENVLLANVGAFGEPGGDRRVGCGVPSEPLLVVPVADLPCRRGRMAGLWAAHCHCLLVRRVLVRRSARTCDITVFVCGHAGG